VKTKGKTSRTLPRAASRKCVYLRRRTWRSRSIDGQREPDMTAEYNILPILPIRV